MAPEETIDIRLHGRGGQGTVTLAALLVDAAFRSGWHAVGFPAFGTERTGAPVAAFARLSGSPIRDRSEVRHPSLVVIQDQTLIGAVDTVAGIAPEGLVLVNAETPPDLPEARWVVTVPATELALRHLGVPITSTVMLGALAAASELIGIDEACDAIRDRFPGEAGERNEAAARAAHTTIAKREEAA